MVIGSFTVSVDNKGRIFVPSKWREDFSGTVVVMRGFTKDLNEHFLTVMPVAQYDKFMNDFADIHFSDSRYNDAIRDVMMNMFESQVDGKGRISINSTLLRYAGISGSAVAVATRNNCFELWEPECLAAKTSAYTLIDASKDLQKRANELERMKK